MTNGNLFVIYVNLSDIGLISFIFRSNYPYQVDAQCNRSISSFGMWSHHHPLYSTFSVAYFPKVFIGDNSVSTYNLTIPYRLLSKGKKANIVRKFEFLQAVTNCWLNGVVDSRVLRIPRVTRILWANIFRMLWLDVIRKVK